MLRPKEKAELILDAVKLISLIAALSKDGFTKEEKRQLLEALALFSAKLTKEAID